MTDAEPPWRDSRFPASVEAVRKACGVPAHDHEDDVMIGMMLDRFGWDHAKVEDAYAYSQRRREDLGLAQIKRRILVDGLALQQFPHHNEVGNVIPIFASTSLDRRLSPRPQLRPLTRLPAPCGPRTPRGTGHSQRRKPRGHEQQVMPIVGMMPTASKRDVRLYA